MTGVTRWNKTISKAGADGWNLTTDDGKGLDSANVLVPVATQAERDGLTPPLGKYAGMAVTRADLGGRIEVWDGAKWRPVGGLNYRWARGGATDASFTTPNTNFVSQTITGAPAGNWRIEGQLGMYGNTSATGRIFVSVGSSPTYYKLRQDIGSTPSTYYVSAVIAHSGGDLVLNTGYDLVAGTAVCMAASGGSDTYLMATLLGQG